MTFEHRIVIEPKDIKSFVFECSDCGARLAIPGGANVSHGDRVTSCHSCGKDWMADYTRAAIYWEFMSGLRKVMEAQDGPGPFRVLLEIDDPH